MLYVMIFAFLLVSSDLVQEATCAKGEFSLVIFQPILPQESNFDGKKLTIKAVYWIAWFWANDIHLRTFPLRF